MKIVLIEDDRRTASFIIKGLRQEGYSVDHADDGETGLALALSRAYDVAVIDIMLPKIDGLTLISKLRNSGNRTPALILSAKSSVDDRVKGLQTGGDDYLVKPFAFSELLARIQALLRRATPFTAADILTVDDLTIDIVQRKVYRADKKIELQPKEYALLEYLMRNAGRVISRTMIMEHVWDFNFDPMTNVVDVMICHLRDKIDRSYARPLIHTIRGFGYVLEAKK
jgi:heavy metal response regulator